MKVLIDTNVLISAALSSSGTPFLAYAKAVTHPNHEMCIRDRFTVGQHRCDSLSNIGKQAAFYAVKAGKKVVLLTIRDVAVEVNYLLCQQFTLG